MIKKNLLPIFLLLLALPVLSIETLPLDTDVSFSMNADQSMEFLLYVENPTEGHANYFNISLTVSSSGKGKFLALGLYNENRKGSANLTEFMEQEFTTNVSTVNSNNSISVMMPIDNGITSFYFRVATLDFYANDSENYAKLILFTTVDVNVSLNVSHYVNYPIAIDPEPAFIIPIGWVLPFFLHPRLLKKLKSKSRKES